MLAPRPTLLTYNGKDNCCFEAGYDGFWLHRWLCEHDIENRVLDAASLLVDRRARRAKTDRLDAAGLLRTLMALERGEAQVCRVVHGIQSPTATLPTRAGALGSGARPAQQSHQGTADDARYPRLRTDAARLAGSLRGAAHC